MVKQFLNEKELSKMVGRSLSSLRHDRAKGVGLPYTKLPGQRRVYYDLEDVLRVMKGHKIVTSDSAGLING